MIDDVGEREENLRPIIVVRHDVLPGMAPTRDPPWETRRVQPHPLSLDLP